MRRVTLMVVALALAAACTFPSPDIVETCPAPETCKQAAEMCAKKADQDLDTCLNMGMGGCTKPECEQCQADHQTAIGKCFDACQNCSTADGCLDSTASCKALTGSS